MAGVGVMLIVAFFECNFCVATDGRMRQVERHIKHGITLWLEVGGSVRSVYHSYGAYSTLKKTVILDIKMKVFVFVKIFFYVTAVCGQRLVFSALEGLCFFVYS